jgi:hydroxyacylglutathione hydrolase
MIFGHFLIDVNESNSYIAGCVETREALLVDCAELDPRIPAFLEEHGLKLTTIFITHKHFDHTAGLRDALDRFDVKAYSATGKAGGCTVEKARHGDMVRVGRLECRIAETPGHTPESISIILPGMAFTGDALFAGSIGGTTSDANKQKEIAAIREHIFTLDDTWEVHPGHGPSSTVGVEKRYNPFFV